MRGSEKGGSLPERRSRARKRALVADADVLSRIELRVMLEMHGYEVDEVTDGMEAIGLLDLAGPKLDLVYLDGDMPGLNAFETLQALRALQPGLRALLGIAGDREFQMPETPLEGVAVLRKPFSLHELSEAMGRAFGLARHVLTHGHLAHAHWIRVAGHLPHYPPR